VSKNTHKPAAIAFRGLLREIREQRGLTQADVAERLCVPQSFVSKYEVGERRLDFPETVEVCAALEIPLNDFSKLYLKRAPVNTGGTTITGNRKRTK
jgi:transcriptional regulator with XRE-family HTH domain